MGRLIQYNTKPALAFISQADALGLKRTRRKSDVYIDRRSLEEIKIQYFGLEWIQRDGVLYESQGDGSDNYGQDGWG